MKQFFQKIWQKVKSYLGYIAAFLGAVIGFILLRTKRAPSAADELKKQQDIRGEKADEIMKETDQIVKVVDEKIKDMMEKRNERRSL